MEIFLEFVSAIALSLVLSFFLAKILSFPSSPSASCDYDLASGLRTCRHLLQKVVTGECGSETKERDGFVAKVLDADTTSGESKNQENILLDHFNITEDEVLKEVKMGRVVEENFGGFGVASSCSESDKLFTKDEVSVEEIEAFESNCGNEINDANENIKVHDVDCQELSVDESNQLESEKMDKIKSESTTKTEVGVGRSEEIEVLETKCHIEFGDLDENEKDDVKEVLVFQDDDWEGIERTELERLFGAAVAFVGNKCNANKISSIASDVKMQLYGLHKIATVGPCHESQPMAFKVSARANWNAWKQLGNMTPEIAMEQYVTILCRTIPGCLQNDIGGDIKQVSVDAEACSELADDLKANQVAEGGALDKRQKICNVCSNYLHCEVML